MGAGGTQPFYLVFVHLAATSVEMLQHLATAARADTPPPLLVGLEETSAHCAESTPFHRLTLPLVATEVLELLHAVRISRARPK